MTGLRVLPCCFAHHSCPRCDIQHHVTAVPQMFADFAHKPSPCTMAVCRQHTRYSLHLSVQALINLYLKCNDKMIRCCNGTYVRPDQISNVREKNVQQPDLAQLSAGPRECRPSDCEQRLPRSLLMCCLPMIRKPRCCMKGSSKGQYGRTFY